MRDSLRRSLSTPGRVQVLALSGGGQWGAFGAGFLKGWTRRGDRPAAFQVVTGTSTGSLQATFAFLGSDFDDTLGRGYLDIRGDADVMDKRFLLTAALFQDALATTGPLRRRLEAQHHGRRVRRGSRPRGRRAGSCSWARRTWTRASSGRST